jgi:hypothetical protein
MDRTSSSHNLRTTDTSQDNSINNKQTQSKKPSGIISIKYQSNTLSLTSTKRLTSTEHPKRAPNTNVSINCKILGDEKTNPYKDGKFADIQEETRDAYNALTSFENSVIKFHKAYDSIKNDPTKIAQWKEFKSERNSLSQKNEAIDENNNLQASPGYVTLSGTRKPSDLEKLLAGSPLSTKLDPLTGVFRDSKTGLYAELKPLGSKPRNYALCFGSTGVGRMTMKQIKVDIDQVLNQRKIPAAYKQAVELAHALEVSVKASIKKELEEANNLFGGTSTITNEEINTEFKKTFNLTVSGQSMGGGIANYVGLKLGVKSVCFNAAPLGGAATKDLKNSGCLTKENIALSTIINQDNDIVAAKKYQKIISQLADVDEPQNIGQIYVAKKTDIPDENIQTRGYQARHLTSSFQRFYYPENIQAPQPDTPSDNSDASSESSSASSSSGGEKS